MSLAAAAPIIVDQDGRHYMMQIFKIQPTIDRSDQEISGTSGSGYDSNYGSSYGGSYSGSDYGSSHGGDFSAGTSEHLESSSGLDSGHQDFSSGGGYDGGHGSDDGSHGISLDSGHNYVHSVPVSEHVEVTKPVAIPVYKHIGKVFLLLFFSRLRSVFEIYKKIDIEGERKKKQKLWYCKLKTVSLSIY